MNQKRSWSSDSGQSPSPVGPLTLRIGGGWWVRRGLALLLPQLLEQRPLLGRQRWRSGRRHSSRYLFASWKLGQAEVGIGRHRVDHPVEKLQQAPDRPRVEDVGVVLQGAG